MDSRTFDIIEKIAKEHSRNIKRKPFGYLDRNDLRNEIWAICLERLKDFDKERGELEHYLRVSVKNRLVNRYKDITKSVRPPCPRCPFYDPGNSPSDCSKFGDDRHLCNKWRNYQLSVESRNSLLNSAESSNERYAGDDVLNKVLSDEIKQIVLEKIDKEYRYDLEQLISNGKISKQKLKRLKIEISKILDPNPDSDLDNNKNETVVQLTINKKIIKKQKKKRRTRKKYNKKKQRRSVRKVIKKN